MPATDEITIGELARNFASLTPTLERIEGKLDSRPSWESINRIEAAHAERHAKQDEAIKALQDAGAYTVRTALTAIFTAGLSAAGALLVFVITR